MKRKQKVDFNNFEHQEEMKWDKLIVGSLIVDFFYEFIENEISHISEYEIMEFLGVPEKKIDFHNVVLYDTKKLKSILKNQSKSEVYDMIDKMMQKMDFNNRDFV